MLWAGGVGCCHLWGRVATWYSTKNPFPSSQWLTSHHLQLLFGRSYYVVVCQQFGAFCQPERLPSLQPVRSCRFCCEANNQTVNCLSPASPSLKSPVELGHRVVGCFLPRLCCAATFNVYCLWNTKLVSKLNSFQWGFNGSFSFEIDWKQAISYSHFKQILVQLFSFFFNIKLNGLFCPSLTELNHDFSWLCFYAANRKAPET